MTFDIGLHEVWVRAGGRAGVLYVITKFSRMDILPNFVTHGAPLRALCARESSAINDIHLSSSLLKFILIADYTNVIFSNTDLNMLQDILNSEFDKALNWLIVINSQLT